ncbi:SCO4402 family protein [Streptomyces sp. bgisy027]|uniref:SCO4402 family protein n=1 Tax=Streptomyces sp. bgisy027 TaxID=3413770 RepID=UPI003D72169B
MPPDDRELQTPWLRDQLVDWLLKIGDRARLEENWVSPGDSALDHMLDFFDDTGVLDDPVGRVGFILRNEGEVEAMQKLNFVIDRAIQGGPGSDVAVIRSQMWEPVVSAAREALRVMAVAIPYDD